jgi:protein-tyrosine phosphatase
MLTPLRWIDAVAPHRLAFFARPRAGDWLADEVRAWKLRGLHLVVSLLEPDEIADLKLEPEPSLCAASGIAFISFPIEDRRAPRSLDETQKLVGQLLNHLRAGEAVGIHCRAGIGRFALIAGCVMVALGIDSSSVFAALSHARGGPVPDTPEQVAWLNHFAGHFPNACSPARPLPETKPTNANR